MTGEREQLLAELEALRVSDGFSVADMANKAPTITSIFGGSDPQAAIDRLRVLEVDDSDRRFIDAALVGLALSQHKGNIDERFASFGQSLDTPRSQRTVRRWCDQGFELLADIILAVRYETPGFRVYALRQNNGTVVFDMRLGVLKDEAPDAWFDVSWTDAGGQTEETALNVNTGLVIFTTPELKMPASLKVRWEPHHRPYIRVGGGDSVVHTGDSVEVSVSEQP